MQRWVLVILGAICTVPASAEVVYSIDWRHTFPIFEVSHYGWSLQRGRFNRTSGTAVLDREARTGRIEVEIDAASLDMGLEDWTEEMQSEDWFDVERYPTITYRSARLNFAGDSLTAAEGTLTLLGVSRPVRLEITGFSCGRSPFSGKHVCGGNVTAQIKRSDFGMTKLLPGIGDEVTIRFGVEAVEESPFPQ